MASREPGSRTRWVSRRTRAGSPSSFRVPPQTAPFMQASANGREAASARTREVKTSSFRARREASFSMEGEMSTPITSPESPKVRAKLRV